MTIEFFDHVSLTDNKARHADLGFTDYWAFLEREGITRDDMDRYAKELHRRLPALD